MAGCRQKLAAGCPDSRRARAARGGTARVPSGPALHRLDQVPVQRLSRSRPGRVQGAAPGDSRGRQPGHRHRRPAPSGAGHGRDDLHRPHPQGHAALARGHRRRAATPRRLPDPDRAEHHARRLVRGADRRRRRGPARQPDRAPARRRDRGRDPARRLGHRPPGRRDPHPARPALPARSPAAAGEPCSPGLSR